MILSNLVIMKILVIMKKSGKSSDSNESCYVGESGDLINKVILVILVNQLILINCVGVVIF